jgi:hypothetical protein
MMEERVSTQVEPLDQRIAKLPVDEKWHLPVPWFVSWIDGKPDFRVADGKKWMRAAMEELCWICGERLGKYQVFAIGPMCSINRVSADPPMHASCARYAVHTCPFMLTPKVKRRETDRPEGLEAIGGNMIERNPGVTLLWTAERGKFSVINDGAKGFLFRLWGDPVQTAWYKEGRAATRSEVEASIESGLPILSKMAAEEGKKALQALERMKLVAQTYLPHG